MKKILILITLCVFSYSANINIAAAANVAYAFKELESQFKKENPDTTINVTLGASGNLVTQIQSGAPFDIFMAANMKFAQKLYDENLAITKPVIYAQGAIALLTLRTNITDLSKGLESLQNKNVKLIAIANPKTAPYGEASIEALKNLGIYENLKNKIIEAKSIGEALTQTLTATDAGFIAASALYEEGLQKYNLKENTNYILVDPKLYTPIDQGIVITKHGENNVDAKKFYDFVLSEKGRAIFKAYGYNIP
ncbi:molybdate ABC transporter substrate-binding protein [Campylobacter insulaenigrae]|uniref:molybdate ABC transporter substrate-binding protein n=1 Tax=Campylobacter insulaenigrae TaxID=260714 RepID=UPI0021532E09|nr:molybdate ABC transporter substrate-binding protein [Campylobacter insulaenigrae]MCR6572435.1 molybdate ABC transporter substrate-binding protein [Campylobacter insulaenigrae]MCR6574119.1 molybdate ABC transporter substrate-binding protein [Campylobacter insulaenigrae]MCR6575126.1 molybdate ABC transporter substrate-binding protein [Campylobacter insulaenigrae]MCR6577171.1 molybdate ABC transporter substrate-binding protein [Campylobacter insulaenigrae]MCR6578650.1 molybdate ABC transporter